jgi:hypothetical protein
LPPSEFAADGEFLRGMETASPFLSAKAIQSPEFRGRRRFAPFIAVLAVVASLETPVATGAEIYGQVTQGGQAVASQGILLNGRLVGKTDESGGYRLSLPPGQYTLLIRNMEVQVLVPPPGIRKDIQLK